MATAFHDLQTASIGSRIGDIAHAHCTSSGCGKGEAHINWSMGLPEKATPRCYLSYHGTNGPCASGLSVVTPLERNFCKRLTRWRFSGVVTTPWWKAGGKRGAREYAPHSAWAWRMSGLTRDGTAESVSRDQILRRERGQGFFFSLFS